MLKNLRAVCTISQLSVAHIMLRRKDCGRLIYKYLLPLLEEGLYFLTPLTLGLVM